MLNKSGVSDKYFSYFSTNIYVVATCGYTFDRAPRHFFLPRLFFSLFGNSFEKNVASDPARVCTACRSSRSVYPN